MRADIRPAGLVFSREARRRLAVLAFLAASLFVSAASLRPAAKPPPLEIALWYWHAPFDIPPFELQQLQAMGVRRLFVRAGVARKAGSGVRLTLPQVWRRPASTLEVQLVFNFGYDVVRAFGEMPNGDLARSIGSLEVHERNRAEAAGVHVAGVQLDLDCPTSKLPKYAELLKALRPVIAGQRLQLSVTALPTWLGSRRMGDVAAQVDFLVPQFYEAETPRTRQELAGISSLARFERGLAAAGRLGVPFYAGVPAYGHALVYDEKDRLLGLFHDMGPDDAIRTPGFHLDRTFGLDAHGKPADAASYTGEDIAEFTAPPIEGNRPYRLLYDLPSPAMVAKHLALMRAGRPANCLGAVLFRYPETGERATLPLSALRAAIAGQPAGPSLQMRIQTSSAPWELIETGRRVQRPPVELRISAKNVGAATSLFAEDAVRVTLVLNHPGVEEMALPSRGYDSVRCYYTDRPDTIVSSRDESSLMRSSPARANVLVFEKCCLGPGENLATGPVRLPADGATSVRGWWSARMAGGFETISGSLASTRLVAGSGSVGDGKKVYAQQERER